MAVRTIADTVDGVNGVSADVIFNFSRYDDLNRLFSLRDNDPDSLYEGTGFI